MRVLQSRILRQAQDAQTLLPMLGQTVLSTRLSSNGASLYITWAYYLDCSNLQKRPKKVSCSTMLNYSTVKNSIYIDSSECHTLVVRRAKLPSFTLPFRLIPLTIVQ
jgi:hypothetical protein